MKKPMTLDRMERIPPMTDAIGGTNAPMRSITPSTTGLMESNIPMADCLMFPTMVENFPLTVWLSLSLMPLKAPPSLVAWAMAAATASKPICPLLIIS